MSQTTLKRLPVVFLPLIFALLPHARGWNETVHLDSPALVGNKIGNPTRRRVFIYLPPGYERDSDRYYPTLYVLHGWGGDDKIGQTVSDIADKLILDGDIKPMILAAPDTKGKTYIGTFYTNSSLNGRWEDFITQDLVQFVERNYRAVRRSRSRGIMGVSMGGYGAIKLALKHPDIFSVVYGNVPALLRFSEPDPVGFPMWAWQQIVGLQSVEEMLAIGGAAVMMMSSGAALAANLSNPPFFFDVPYQLVGGQLEKVDRVFDRIVAETPLAMLDNYEKQVRQLKGIAFDAATQDVFIDILPSCKEFSQALDNLKIDHTFEVFTGGHTDRFADRCQTTILPFFSDLLLFGQEFSITQIAAKAKLAVTWGQIKSAN